MTHTLRFALRNLLRNRRRSITTLLAMMVGVSAILLFGGYSRDITYGLQTDFVQRSGHLQIQRKGYFLYGTGNSAAYGIGEYKKLIETLQADPVIKPMLTVVTPTLQLGGIAGNFASGVSRTVLAQGIVADDQGRLTEWNEYNFPIKPRPSALSGTPENALLIGHGVARVLQLCKSLQVSNCEQEPNPDLGTKPAASSAVAAADTPDDVMALSALESPASPNGASSTRIEVLAANAHGAPNVGSFIVVKAEQQGVKELDDVHVAMHLPRAQRLVYGSETPQVTAIVLQLHHTAQIPQARQRIESILAQQFAQEPLEVLDFATLNPFYDQTNRMFSAIFGFVFALIGAIVLFVVSNTMSMAIVERTIEIGTLRAIGQRRSGIQSLFICEGLVLGLVGSGLGVIIALVLAWVVNHSGLYWTPPARIDSVALTVRVWGEWKLIVLAFVGLTLVAGLSAWWPARRAARLHIVEALRHV